VPRRAGADKRQEFAPAAAFPRVTVFNSSIAPGATMLTRDEEAD
jgi:hypothetical protein